MAEPEVRFFTRCPLKTIVAARPETGSAVIFNPQTNVWDISVKDYYQIVSDANYHEISKEQAESVFGENLPKFGVLNLIDIIKLKRLKESE